MGWAVGERFGRHIGYGVPATCDHPDCGKGIDRGLGYACGGGVAGSVENCGLFFCEDHRAFFIENDDEGGESVCERCAKGEEAFDPSPDTPEWARHVLTDESWAQWREDYPELARRLARLAQAPPVGGC